MELIDRSEFSVISCKAKSQDFIDGVCFIMDKIDAAPVAFDVDKVIQEIEDYGKYKGLLMNNVSDPTKFNKYIPVREVIRIIKEQIKSNETK